MTTLAQINGEALAVPGLRFWGNRDGYVFAIIAQDELGAAELWWDSRHDHGGIELHSPRDWGRFGAGQGPMNPGCTILGGDCWSDGSLTAWYRVFLPLVEAADSAGVLRELARWHATHLGGAS